MSPRARSLATAGSVEAPAARSAPNAAAGYRFTVVAHTHWDREWYLPFEQFRMRLARTIDEVVEVLEADPCFRSFTLDGQSVTLEDYAEVRPPDAVERLRRLVAEGRVITGPSYVLPDEFLAGQETLVRNLIAGARVVRAWGGKPMGVGYLPDTFGHVGQLPQILRGFGLDAFIFWRGLDDRGNGVGLAFEWRAPDGTSVTAIRQLGGYGNSSQIGRWAQGGVDLVDDPEAQPDAAAARFERFLAAWRPEIERTGVRELLLCNGSDHQPIHRPLPDLVEHGRDVHPNHELEIGSYDEYRARLRSALAERPLPIVEGELVGGRDAPVLRGINSARISLKQEAEATERALLVAESFASLALLAGRYAVPVHELRRGWQEHLRNMPHDSISGCSVDETHRDMLGRFGTARRIADRVEREALAALAGREAPWTYRPPVEASVSVVNPLPSARRVLVELPLPDELAEAESLVALPSFAHDAADPAVVAAALPAQRLPAREEGSSGTALVALDLDGFGARTVTLVAGGSAVPDPSASGGARVVAGDTIENEHLRVTLHADGSLSVVELATGRRLERLNVLEDEADRGDEYNFCPLEGDRPRRPDARAGRVVATAPGPVVAELTAELAFELPARLSPDRRRRSGRVSCPVRVSVRLTAGVPRVEVETAVGNAARDHRLRVRFAAPGATHSTPVRAEGHFDVVHRPMRPNWSGAAWVEPPAFTAHTAGAVALGDLVVVGRGLPEHEAVPVHRGVDLALTLLRCVGWLSRDDLSTRPGHAGPGIPTPDAQCLGQHTFRYALAFEAARLSDAALCRLSADARTPVGVGPTGALTAGLVEVDGDVAWATLKPAEDGDGAVLRLYAPGAGTRLDVRSIASLTAARLDETPTREDPLAPLEAGEIRTIRLRLD
ncbi:MAG TPA: glycoside hydrolase family 38 C-terminal domain-containing protein [Candidatus Limnocylindrales bacterium]|nr:glycoside hydrolase family 38 C-terminal domain-containing protein [Candidatus Limnocylindrales bacterium]